MTDDDILMLALEYCSGERECDKCPYCYIPFACTEMKPKAGAVIRRQREKIKSLEMEIEQLKSENEEMRRDLEKENVRKTKSKLIKFFENKKINNKGE